MTDRQTDIQTDGRTEKEKEKEEKEEKKEEKENCCGMGWTRIWESKALQEVLALNGPKNIKHQNLNTVRMSLKTKLLKSRSGRYNA